MAHRLFIWSNTFTFAAQIQLKLTEFVAFSAMSIVKHLKTNRDHEQL
jgi:hypothetical protein